MDRRVLINALFIVMASISTMIITNEQEYGRIETILFCFHFTIFCRLIGVFFWSGASAVLQLHVGDKVD